MSILSRQKEFSSKKGTVLINAFWILFILLLVVSAFAWRISLELKISKLFTLRLKTLYAARSAISWANEIKKNLDMNPHCDYLDENWAGKRENDIFKDQAIGETEVSIKYLDHYDETGAPVYYYGLIDEERKINLNIDDLNVLRMFLGNLMRIINTTGTVILTSDIIEAIIDWRDTNQLTRNNEEENNYYGYLNRNGKFKVLEELLLLKGMDKEKFAFLQKYLTVYGTGKININTSDREILTAMVSVFSSISQIAPYLDRLVNEIIEFRPFSSVADLFNLPVIQEVLSSLPEEIRGALISSLQGVIDNWITFTSSAFQTNIEVEAGNVKKTVRAVFNHPEGRIIYWNEN